MLSFLKNLFKKEPQIFLSSDLHLDHKNIIKYCDRPFKDVHEMNYTLIKNWNKTVRKEDIVYFLGDFTMNRVPRQRVIKFIRSLNGKKIFVRGNHDKFLKSYKHFILNYKGESFYLVHSPWEIPSDWKGWAIFGHTHNKGSFIDYKNKRINVSTEQTGYKPISINKIIQLIHKKGNS